MMRGPLGSLAAAALLTAILAGCGSGSSNPAAQASREVAQRTAELQRAEALERAEGRDPRKTEAHEVAQHKRERAATRAKEAAEHVKEARESQTEVEQEHLEEAQREARQRQELEIAENSPESHHYPASVRAGFLHGCEHSTGHEDSACKCALKRIEAKVPLGRYRENEHEVVAGRPLSLIYSVEYGYCVGQEAASG